MGIVYLAALILGLGTIVLQLGLSHLGGGDADHVDGEIDGEADLGEVDHDASIGHSDLSHGGAHGEHDVGGAAALFLSMRFWTFLLMAFGMVGTALHYLDLASGVATLLLSASSGVISGLAVSLVFRALKPGVSSGSTQDDAVGKIAKVMVPVRKGGLGKVRVEIKGRRVDLLATSDGLEVQEGDEVVVVEFRGEHALVEPLLERPKQ